MPSFSKVSEDRIKSCHPALAKLMYRVIQDIDISILEGYRSTSKQLALYDEGKSKVLKSKHNHTILDNSGEELEWSLAINIAPYPVNFGKTPKDILRSYVDTRMDAEALATLDRQLVECNKVFARFYYMAGRVQTLAESMGITIRWGGDWDSDKDFFDQTFDDLVHFELVGYELAPLEDGSIPDTRSNYGLGAES
jgi:hypothetical protein